MKSPRKIYPRLNRGQNNLFDAYTEQELRSKLIVKYDDKNGFYKFTVFDNPWDLYQHVYKLPKQRRCFFEVVTNLTCRKPHFDIDFIVSSPEEISAILVIPEVINASSRVLKKYSHTLDLIEDVIVLQSHGWKGDSYKVSYHIIIDNFYLQTNLHAKQFCQEVLSEMNDYRDFIDDKIYSSVRQFRIVGNSKYGSTRYLEQQLNWFDDDLLITTKPRNAYQLFLSSLIGVTGHCEKINISLPEKKDYSGDYDIREDEVIDAFEKFKEYVKDCPFTIREVDNGLIILNRESPSECPICKTIHNAENPYLILTKNKKVLFNCRRSDTFLNIGEVNYFDEVDELDKEFYFIEPLSPKKKKTRRRLKKTPMPPRFVETIRGELSSSSEEDSE